MSFASFDYSKKLTLLNSNVANATATVASQTDELAKLNTITGYDAILAPQKLVLQRSIDFMNENITAWNNVIAEINRVLTLSDADHAKLYSLYQLSGESQDQWMSKMLFNTTEILETGSPILVDNSLDNNCKCMIAKIILQKININRNANMI